MADRVEQKNFCFGLGVSWVNSSRARQNDNHSSHPRPKTHLTSPLLRLWGCGCLSEDNVKMNRYLVMVKFSREILVWGWGESVRGFASNRRTSLIKRSFCGEMKVNQIHFVIFRNSHLLQKIFYKTKIFRKKFLVGRSSIIFFPSWFACSAQAPHMLTLRVLGDRPFGAHPSHTSPPRPDAKTQTRTSC